MKKIQIAPSILAADFAKLGEEVRDITAAGADMIHIDVMDGHFVPNLTIGACVVKALKKYSDLPFDVHLMIENADNFIAEFADAGADIITVHAESLIHLDRTVNLIKKYNIKAGVSLVPSTSLRALDYILDELDLVLIMSVNPGFGGQKFLHSQINKIKELRSKIDKLNKDIKIQVDGGINNQTAKLAIEAGADILVAGTYIFAGGAKNYKKNIEILKQA